MNLRIKIVFCFVLIFVNSFVKSQTSYTTGIDNSCVNPVYLNDTVNSIKVEAQMDKLWFLFKADSSITNVLIFAGGGEMHCEHLIFDQGTRNICDSIEAKKVMPLRTKVCDRGVMIDYINWISKEEVQWGVCNCSKCCGQVTELRTEAGRFYYIVVYGDYRELQIGLNSKQMKTKTNPELYEYDPFDYVEIEVGTSIQLDNILFKSNGTRFMPESYSVLEKLAKFMKNHPTVTIEIQGHVNAPGEKNTLPQIKLSGDRAVAVSKYLIESGIDASRMVTKGYGNSRMVYPRAKSEREFKKNRRVEVLITGK